MPAAGSGLKYIQTTGPGAALGGPAAAAAAGSVPGPGGSAAGAAGVPGVGAPPPQPGAPAVQPPAPAPPIARPQAPPTTRATHRPSAAVIGAGILLGVLFVAAAAGAAMVWGMYHQPGPH